MSERKDYIPEIAQILGVKINEEFKIKLTEYGEVLGCRENEHTYRFDTELVRKGYNDGWSEWYGDECDKVLYSILLGKYEIVKIDN